MSLVAERLRKNYGKANVLSDVSFSAGPGVTVVTGPSGGGKSTLLRVLATLERPTSGRLLWEGVPIARRKRAYRHALGYAPQSLGWPEALTAREFLRHIGALKTIPRADVDRQAEALLGRLGLLRDIDRPIRTFSGGMRRRLSLAQALLGAPRLLLLDEPTAELDPETATRVEGLIFEQAGQGATVLMTTHRAEGLRDQDVAHLRVGN